MKLGGPAAATAELPKLDHPLPSPKKICPQYSKNLWVIRDRLQIVVTRNSSPFNNTHPPGEPLFILSEYSKFKKFSLPTTLDWWSQAAAQKYFASSPFFCEIHITFVGRYPPGRQDAVATLSMIC